MTKIEKRFNRNSFDLEQCLLKTLKQLNCNITSHSENIVVFESNASGWEWFKMNGNYIYRVEILEETAFSSLCTIHTLDALDASIPLFGFSMSKSYASKILNMMSDCM